MKLMIKRILLAAVWITFACVLYKNGLFTTDYGKLFDYIQAYGNYFAIPFVILSTVRVFIFIPSVVFIVLGSMLFAPFSAFGLSMASMVLSQTIIYGAVSFLGLHKLKTRLLSKHPTYEHLIDMYNFKFLGLGILCPVAPTDAVCFLSASAGLKYWKYILTVIVANIPFTLLLSLAGGSLDESLYVPVVLVIIIILSTLFTIQAWNNLKRGAETDTPEGENK